MLLRCRQGYPLENSSEVIQVISNHQRLSREHQSYFKKNQLTLILDYT